MTDNTPLLVLFSISGAPLLRLLTGFKRMKILSLTYKVHIHLNRTLLYGDILVPDMCLRPEH